MSTKKTETTPVQLVEVTLAKEHTHAGKKHPVGTTLTVSERRRQLLINNGKVDGPKANS